MRWVKMEEPALGLPELLMEETNSPPLSRSDDDDETEYDSVSSGGEDEQVGIGAGGGGGRGRDGAPALKKGPWTPEEDKRLREYVEAHGEGNWNQVQRNARLNRCGKSCRLRWTNHLRADLKKGPFDEEEEQKIIKLHAMMGNKWAKMAAFLPGRTDNEIKNYWNTRSKRLQRTGLPLYPDSVLSQVSNRDMNCQSLDEPCGKKCPNELSQGNGLEFDEIVFENLDYKKHAAKIVVPNFAIPNYLSVDAMNPLKYLASSDGIISGCNGGLTCEQLRGEPEKICHSTDFNSGITKNQSVPVGGAIASGHPIVNGNFSTSGTVQRPMEMELPSLQCPNYDLSNNWLYNGPSGSPIEKVDTFTQSPASVLLKSEHISSQNTGLLDALVHEGHVLGDPTNSQGSFEVSFPDASYNQVLQSNDPMSSSSSALGLDAFFVGSKHHTDTEFPDKYLSAWEDSWMPDASLEASFSTDASLEASFSNDVSPQSKDQASDTLNVLIDGDSCEAARLSAAGQGHQPVLESCPWKSMPGACDMPEFRYL